MVALILLLFNLVAALFKSTSRLEAENAALRHQLTVLQLKVHGRIRFTNSDRLFFVQLYRWFNLKTARALGIERAGDAARPRRRGDRVDSKFAALHMSALGTKRLFAAIFPQ